MKEDVKKVRNWCWGLSQSCIFLLMVDAAAVFIGLANGQNMWLLIVGYWLILTIKNLIDYVKGVTDHE